jgi:hypothetical protein
VNHRELILSADKKARFHFLKLPEQLQDEVIDGLDNGTLTLEAASDLVGKRKHGPLSHEAIAGYYRAVRRERRLFEANMEVSRLVAEFADKPTDQALKSLVNLVISTALVGIADGQVGIKDIKLSDLLKATSVAGTAADATGKDALAQAGTGGLSEEAAAEIRKKILGIK